jgi:hypothetical protein
LAYDHPDFKKYPLMEELVLDIKEADNRVLMHRIRYDNFVFEFNQLIDDESLKLEQIMKEKNISKLPVFTLSQN